jgi:hypothetical protein
MSQVFLKLINADNKDSFNLLTKKEVLSLELKLNVTKYGKKWSNLGDILFNFQGSATTNEELTITQEQFDFFEVLLERENWQECRNL